MSEFQIPRYESVDNKVYEELGYKSGLEIHQQLLTEKKLFCRCPAGIYNNEYDSAVLRHMRPTLSELGEYDGTALMEFKKKKDVVYLLNNETVCTYEMDDTPPFMINQNALDIAIEIALLLKCSIVGELHIIRKQYLDGSIPTGFQRTAIVGLNGWIPYEKAKDGKVYIRQLAIEEDSCRELSDKGHEIRFITDRLSMPLIEIVTEPDMLTPEDIAEVGRRLAMLTRSTGKIRRGPGAGRQDVNVSIAGGTRVEIKGVSTFKWIPRLTHYEAFRQKAFLVLKDELEKANFEINDNTFVEKDIKSIVIDTLYEPILKTIETEGDIRAIKIKGFAPYAEFPVHPGRTFMSEISSILRVVACLDDFPNILFKPNIVPQFGIAEWDKIRAFIGADEDDLVCIIHGSKADVSMAMGEIRDRITVAREVGVPNETRRSIVTGVTEFERVLPGPSRMYPDTDLPPLSISENRIERIRSQMPKDPYERKDALMELGVSMELVVELFTAQLINLYETLIKKNLPFSHAYLAKTLTQTTKSLRRQGSTVDNLVEDDFRTIISAVSNNLFSKEAIEKVMVFISKAKKAQDNETYNIKLAPEVLIIPKVAEAQVNEIVKSIIDSEFKNLNDKSKNSEVALRFLMGKLMHTYRGSIDGKIFYNAMQKELEKKL